MIENTKPVDVQIRTYWRASTKEWVAEASISVDGGTEVISVNRYTGNAPNTAFAFALAQLPGDIIESILIS